MIQVNLIPDLKAEYLKSVRTKRIIVTLSFLVSTVFIGLVVLMSIYVYGVQRTHTNNLNSDIEEAVAKYKGAEGVDKIVTIQKQLETLPSLHDQKALISRLSKYLATITPEQVVVEDLSISMLDGTMTFSGTADSVPDVNRFANTLKNAFYQVGDDKTKIPAFTNVPLGDISANEENVDFSLDTTFDTALFFNHESINLVVPQIDSTNSEVGRPNTSKNPKNSNANPFEGGNN